MQTENTNSGFFASFNARHLDTVQVAQSFVPNSKFTQLVGLQHSLLVGARGSGKTHMLKMLQPKALNRWTHSSADSIRNAIPYFGVFIPADEAWRQQVEITSEAIPGELQNSYRMAVFTTHVQRSLVDCFIQLTRDRSNTQCSFGNVTLDANGESEICKTLAVSWKLTPRIHSFFGVRQALVDRLGDLYDAAENPQLTNALLALCQRQPVQAVLQGTGAFDTQIGRFEGRWCLMFDELEIAPIEIQKILFRSLRSTDQSILFKLALSPSAQAASVFREVLGPSVGNDFDEISLYSDSKETQVFCEALWDKLTIGTNAEHLKPTAVLSHSLFYEPDTANPYSKTGRWQAASTSLAKKDASYVKFLSRYGIDPNDLWSSAPNLKNTVIRKIGPIVGYRDHLYHFNPKSQKVKIRNDKSKPATIYSGWEVLCLVTEGNPRWFTGIVRNLLIKRDSSVSKKELSKEAQYDSLLAASQKFMDYVSTIPSKTKLSSNISNNSLSQMIETLITRFRTELLEDDFSLDPVFSFQVDEGNEDLWQSIIDGLYAGAFIPVGGLERKFAFSKDLSGQRLRLTYLLAPLKVLPLRAGKSRTLSTLLQQTQSILPRKNSRELDEAPDDQPSLFND